MALLGDILFSVRSKIPDLPTQLFPAPSIISLTPASGTFLPVGTWFIVVTLLTPWGETLPSSEGSVTVTAGNQNVTVSAGFPGLTSNIIGVRVYFGQPSGGENQYQQFTGTASVVTLATGTNIGMPPTRSTAFIMDADGPTFGASTVYQWLNEGLSEFSRATGGILDYCGVPTIAGQPLYSIPGHWLEISDVWYGGFWVQGGKRQEFFRRNTVNTSVLSAVSISVSTDQQVMEVSYQPDRSSGVTATTGSMTAASTSVTITNAGAFLLPFGFAQIGTEIVAYASLSGSSLTGLIRSLGASTAQAWPPGTTVTELSLFWCGKRTFGIKYSPGQAYSTLQAPHGWAAILPMWMLAQAKKAEQDIDGALKLEKDFFGMVGEWYRSNKGVTRQVQVGGYSNALTFDNTIAGGILIP